MEVLPGYWSTEAEVTANNNDNTKSIKLLFLWYFFARLEITLVCYNKAGLRCCTGMLDIAYKTF